MKRLSLDKNNLKKYSKTGKILIKKIVFTVVRGLKSASLSAQVCASEQCACALQLCTSMFSYRLMLVAFFNHSVTTV